MSSISKDKLVPIERVHDWDLMERSDFNYCEPKPMSDDVLDRGVQYLRISREILGIDFDKQ